MTMNTRREKELLSPYKIVVVLLIEKYGSLRPKFWESESENLFMFSGRGPNLPPKERKATCMLIANLIQGSDISLCELMDLLESSDISSVHSSAFISGLREMYSSGIESLLTLFDSVEKYCAQDQSRSDTYPCIWTSLVGLHLRQLNLLFRRLGFSHVISLFDKFMTYYENCYKNRPSMLENPSVSASKEVNSKNENEYRRLEEQNETNDNDVDMDETSMNVDSSSPSLNDSSKIQSEEQSKSHLKFYVSSSETNGSSSSTGITVKTRQQAELFVQEQICLLLQNDPSAMPPAQLQQSLASILKSCPDLGKGHFLSYLNCLRVREHTGAIHSLVRAYDSKLMQKDINRGGEDITRTFRYAALNMAALQAQFGHRELGLISLEEAIRLAQESNDHVCLQYALAWLYSLSDSQKLTLMRRSHNRSGEMNLSYLSWLSLLNYTIELSRSKMPPYVVLKRLLEPLSQSTHNRNSLEGGLAGQSGLWSVQAGLWSIWGNIPLTAVCSQLVLHMTPLATTNLYAPSTASPTCAALCNLAIILANLGEFSLSGDVLHHAQQQFPSPWEHSKLWMFAQCFITFYESLRQGLWSQAKAFVVNMATIHSAYSKILEAELLVAKGEFSQSMTVTTALRKLKHVIMEDFSVTKKECDVEPEIVVKAFLLEAEALAGGNNLGGALSTIVKGISIAQEYHMAYLIALGQLQMACVQLHLGLLNEAKTSLERGIDVILSGGGIYDQARAKLLQAKLEVCCATKSNYSESLARAADVLEDAQKLFTQVKAHHREKETVYLKARFYHTCGKMEERNRSALEFRQLEQRHPSQAIVMNMCVF